MYNHLLINRFLRVGIIFLLSLLTIVIAQDDEDDDFEFEDEEFDI